LGEVHCPVLVLAGTESDTYRPEDAARLAGRLPGGRFRLAEGTGHFLPMERPELVVAAIEEVAAHSAE
jgi:pimeloyl-ACP methyl ester carboxylesterase